MKKIVIFIVALLVMSSFASAGFWDRITGKANVLGTEAEGAVSGVDAQKQFVAKTPAVSAQPEKKPGLIARLFGKKEVSTLPAARTEETAPSGGKKPAGEGKAPSGATEPAGKGVSECVQACNNQQKKCLAAKKPAKTCAKEMQDCKAKCQPPAETGISECVKDCEAKCGTPSPPAGTPSTMGFQKASWQCYDNSSGTQGGATTCKSNDVWLGYAKEGCKDKCSNLTGTYKCGVNSFNAYNECVA